MGSIDQSVDERVFGNENSGSSDERNVKCLLDRVRNGMLYEDRKTAMLEIQSVLSISPAAQMDFGAMGFQVILNILKKERDNADMVVEALQTLIDTLTSIRDAKGPADEVQPHVMNSDLLIGEEDSISLLLELLSHEDFYVKYYTLKVLKVLRTNSPQKLTVAIANTFCIRQLMRLTDHEVIRNEALLLLISLNREAEVSQAEEIQKILVSEGAFQMIFSIIKERGSEGEVVQDCLQLLNILLRHSASNQALLTPGFDQLLSVLNIRGTTYKFSQEKTINLLSVLDVINLLIKGGPEIDPDRDSKKLTIKTVLVQKKVLDHLLMLGVESQCAPVQVRCKALHCIGDLIADHPKNLEELGNKRLGEEPDLEPALNSVLRILLRPSSKQEFMAADYLFKNFCQRNPGGQTMLASTLILKPHSMVHVPVEEHINMSFGSMLLHGLTAGENEGDLETCSRAANVLSHVIEGNNQCKEKVLQIELEEPTSILGSPEPLLHRIVKNLVLASSLESKDGKSSTSENVFVQLTIMKLLISLLFDYPNAVQCFLDSDSHLTYLLKLVSNPTTTVSVTGLAAVLLGECVIYNKGNASGKDAYSIVDTISQSVGLKLYSSKFDEMQKSSLFTSAKRFLPHKPLTESTAASMAEIEDGGNESSDQKNEHPMLTSIIDSQFIHFLDNLVDDIRVKMVEASSSPKSQVTVVPGSTEGRSGENDVDCIKQLKTLEKQYHEKSEEVEVLKKKAEDHEAVLNDLLECLGIEEQKVEKLSKRLRELGEDVGKLLEREDDDED